MVYILECIARIEDFTVGGQEVFMQSRLIQDAVLRNLHTLAESSQRLSDSMKATHPEIGWRQMAGFRNVLVHNYTGINLFSVWQVVEADLPHLKRDMEHILRELGGP